MRSNYKFNYSKQYHDGLDEFMGKYEFVKYFKTDVEVTVTSNTSYHKFNDLIEQINNYFANKEIIKKKSYQYYDKNSSKIISEIIFTNLTDKYIVAIIVTGIDNINETDDSYVKDWQDVIDQEIENIKNDEIGIQFKGFALESSENNLHNFIDYFISKGKTHRKKISRELNIIGKNESGLYLQPFETNKQEIDISLNYNDDFYEVSDTVIEALNNKEKTGGIVLFSGLPGTGKSTYMRYLTQKIIGKKLIYISPETISVLGEPAFISFMILHKNSILIVEDAENILKQRVAGETSALSNLLNVTDGLLGDVLKLQVICTFNCKVEDLDEALTRHGRLIAEYKFDKLTLDKTNNLLNKVHVNKGFKSNEPLTISEIYSYDKKLIKTEKQKIKIGFSK